MLSKSRTWKRYFFKLHLLIESLWIILWWNLSTEVYQECVIFWLQIFLLAVIDQFNVNVLKCQWPEYQEVKRSNWTVQIQDLVTEPNLEINQWSKKRHKCIVSLSFSSSYMMYTTWQWVHRNKLSFTWMNKPTHLSIVRTYNAGLFSKFREQLNAFYYQTLFFLK